MAAQTPAGNNEFLFDPWGRRMSSWVVANNFGNEGRIYWDGTLLANRSGNGQTYYSHKDVLGTTRLRTNYQGHTAALESSLAFGDGFQQTVWIPWADQDNDQFAGQEYDAETGTDHATFRQYGAAQGRWMSPDQYDGSYDFSNPQSLNRYSYVLNNPFSYTDPSGLDCVPGGSLPADDGQGTPCQAAGYNPDGTDTNPYAYQVNDSWGFEGIAETWGGSLSSSAGYTYSGGGSSSAPAAPTTPSAPINVPTISPAVCTGAAIAGGASAGALIGEGFGGFIGGLLGGGGGTLVAPGVGTVGGGIAGASAGAGIGAGVGGFIGGLAGGAASNVLCSKGGGSSFGGNQRENKQANDAKNEAERETGKKFNRAQERVFHDEITGQGYGYHELVQIAVQVLQGGHMSQENYPICSTFDALPGKRAWGLTRTHGSMFFLEIGEPLPRRGEKKVHGEWHFLVEVCHWRIEDAGSLLVGSDDPQELIDTTFSGIELGSLAEVSVSLPAHDLLIVFSSGLRLTTYGTSAAARNEWTQWQLYSPDDNVWVANASGELMQVNAYA